jgi:glycine/D-amino acid oxidase-like deaminating enzyme
MGRSAFDIQTDIAILGGGIAGLWLLAKLRAAGYGAVLLEKDALGAAQTLASQGIIHGGMKYAINGVIGDATRALAALPERWKACIEGRGELDLSRVSELADRQLMWTTRGLDSRLAGFFSSKTVRGDMARLTGPDRPPPFDHPAFRGDLYALQEQIIDVPSLIEALARIGEGRIHCGADWRMAHSGEGTTLESGAGRIHVNQLVLAAGSGNEHLLRQIKRTAPKMQRRPLHMVAVRGKLPALYGHCLAARDVPRITVTSHPQPDGEMVWYLGGDVAESGVERNHQAQIDFARHELQQVAGWLDLGGLQWTAFRVDRAERATRTGSRPDSFGLHVQEGVYTLWPTKLALTPVLADAVLEQLPETDGNLGETRWFDADSIRIARQPWHDLEWSA